MSIASTMVLSSVSSYCEFETHAGLLLQRPSRAHRHFATGKNRMQIGVPTSTDSPVGFKAPVS